MVLKPPYIVEFRSPRDLLHFAFLIQFFGEPKPINPPASNRGTAWIGQKPYPLLIINILQCRYWHRASSRNKERSTRCTRCSTPNSNISKGKRTPTAKRPSSYKSSGTPSSCTNRQSCPVPTPPKMWIRNHSPNAQVF